jgi:hypothetical protein
MSQERMIKNVHKWKPMLPRPLGRPKNRWEDDKRKDMKKLKIKNWTSCIQDRNNWRGGGEEEEEVASNPRSAELFCGRRELQNTTYAPPSERMAVLSGRKLRTQI